MSTYSGLPNKKDVKDGVITIRLVAHAAGFAEAYIRGRQHRAGDNALSKALV